MAKCWRTRVDGVDSPRFGKFGRSNLLLHSARWTQSKIHERLRFIRSLIYRRQIEIPAFRYQLLSGPREAAPVGMDVDDSAWALIEPYTYWGEWWKDFILRTHFQFPADWNADEPTVLYLPLGDAGDFSHPEALAYIDGVAYAACDRHHQEIRLPAEWLDGQPHLLALHGWTGLGGSAEVFRKTKLFMQPCLLAQVDQPTRNFVAAARVTLGVVEQLSADDPTHHHLLNALDDAFKLLDIREPAGEGFYASVAPALEALYAGIAEAGAPMDVDVIATGHAHIDVAWLWTLDQTRNKAARTFSTVLRYMEQFPDYHFTQSQPQLYQYIEQDHPDLFRQIAQRISEGRWEIIGGSWVEPDCNASGAESLARQFLLGRRYFRQHFGDVETPCFWLPDTFGYPWALPQLIKEAGLNYFITHKISWNQYNRLPYQSFWWQGLDGTRVLTHFLTTPAPNVDRALPFATTYNGEMTPKEIIGTWRNYLQKEHHNELLTAYGYGDGGGGPTMQMLENAQVMAEFPGVPRLRQGSVREFLERLEKDAGNRLPVWNGELYLEYHRGTYTSQSRTKRNNRKAEFLLHDAEFLAAWAALAANALYPHDDFNRAWELVCLNQFHDILPGSSIGAVYTDNARDFQTIFEIAEAARENALTALAALLPQDAAYIAVNPTSFGGRRVALLADSANDGQSFANGFTGEGILTQAVEGGTLLDLPAISPYSVLPLAAAQTETPVPSGILTATTEADRVILENDLLRAEFDTAGDLVRLYDKAEGRDVLAEGECGNQLQLFEDRPLNFDAWDIDLFYEDKQWSADPAHEMAIIENGPIRVGIEIKRRLHNSELHQRVYLYRDSRRLDFDTWVDWHEHHLLLKVAFPVNILNPMATYDIQWGNIQRPTHRNTSWDWARFETCAYKWVDLSEGGYGVSLLNDCKYGHDIHHNVIRLTLLKSATAPDPNADQGEHRFTYSLYPHAGDWRNGTVAASYDLNNPVIVRRVSGAGTGSLNPTQLIAVDQPNVIIETVKQAEDGNGLIVRLYENERKRGKATLRAGFTIGAAFRCNLLEENQNALTPSENTLTLDLTPYQIVTLRLIPA